MLKFAAQSETLNAMTEKNAVPCGKTCNIHNDKTIS